MSEWDPRNFVIVMESIVRMYAYYIHESIIIHNFGRFSQLYCNFTELESASKSAVLSYTGGRFELSDECSDCVRSERK